jgi:hypothetical protein
MNLSVSPARGRACAAAALVAAAGLVLAACGGSSAPSSSSGNSNTNSPSAGSSTTPASSNSSSPSNSGSTVSAASVPFPIAVGNTWVYKSVALTSLTSTVTNKVLSVTPTSGGSLVTMSNTDSLTGTPTDTTFLFHSDGSITYPSNQFGSSAVIIKGGIVLPPASVIASGQSTTSAVEIKVTSGAMKEDVTGHITVKGDGTASVTVPAGSYSTTVVQMTETFSMLGYTSTVVVKTWMASGVGPVQSEATIDILGHSELASHLELVSFKQG